MLDVKYDIVEETYICDNKSRISYGIAAYDAKSGMTDVFEAFHDISDDKQRVHALVEKCNELGLSLEHFEDVVTDFLSE